MAEIRILPEELRNQIAAGEVIERPASVVKELIENSIDASATEINIEVLGAGKRLIRVSDNGTGMDREDALLCFHSHATSKIKDKEDLFRINTLGFRGEALSSIASVARLTIKTCKKGMDTGIEVSVEGSRVRTREIPYRGTTIEVKNLFYNTPARKKFLRSDRTEVYHIIETVTETALTNPAISFTLRVDGKEVLGLTAAEDIRERIHQVFGAEVVSSLIEVATPDLTVYTSREDRFNPRRINQYIFVNGRPVKDQTLRSAVYRAYENLLPRGKHPMFFIYMTMDPEEVDFNVHPAKREVRFRNSEFIYKRLYLLLRDHLFKGTGSAAAMQKGEKREGPGPEITAIPGSPQDGQGLYSLLEEPARYAFPPFSSLSIGNAFIAYTDGEMLTILDYHAAHERILYERLRDSDDIRVSAFLFPRQVRLSPKEYEIIRDHIDTVRAIGIDMDEFGNNVFMVRAVPEFLFNTDIGQIIRDIAKSLIEGGRGEFEAIRDNIARTIACHSAVRAGHRLTDTEVRELLRELENCKDPEHCPHGRPTRIKFSPDNLRRMFKRR